MFSLTGRTLSVGSAFSPVTLRWEPPSPVPGGGERGAGGWLLGGPRPLRSVFLSRSVSRGGGGEMAPGRCGERKRSLPSRGGGERGTAAPPPFPFFTGGAGCRAWGWTKG